MTFTTLTQAKNEISQLLSHALSVNQRRAQQLTRNPDRGQAGNQTKPVTDNDKDVAFSLILTTHKTALVQLQPVADHT